MRDSFLDHNQMMPPNNISTVDEKSFPYIFEQNTDIVRPNNEVLRCNVYRPKSGAIENHDRYPVLVTYGPYGKDVPYSRYHAKSWSELDPAQKSAHSAWEVPDPAYWTSNGYVVVRVDERGIGQSPGLLDTMSRGTSEAFFDVVEWCADQAWSSGKVGLLGISYYAGTQWRVAARKPRGLAAMIPWEGMSDYYRDRVRHGGILSDKFIEFWWSRGVVTNQYGRPGKAARNWGPDTIDGDLSEEELVKNRQDQTIDTAKYKFADEDYYTSKEFDLADIDIPLLSVANWGGILLHLRGNVVGWQEASSRNKFLRFIVGRHDLPFYYPNAVRMQKSFLDAFLKDKDSDGWSTGKMPRVSMLIRKGDGGVDDPIRENSLFKERFELDWPLPDTNYRRYFLRGDSTLSEQDDEFQKTFSYDAMAGEPLQFTTRAVTAEQEITGHIVAHLTVSMSPHEGRSPPSDLDLFVTLRHLDPAGKEIFYTGTMGDAVPVVKGWLRLSHRATDPEHKRHKSYLPYRSYSSTSTQDVNINTEYSVDVEIWPTNVVLEVGDSLVFEVAGHDTQGTGHFEHSHPHDRAPEVFSGINRIVTGCGSSWLVLPVIPSRE